MKISSDKLPLDLMDEFAKRESYNRYYYRPVYSMHKWWARRPGSTFRILGLAALTDETVDKDDILERNSTGGYQGLYLNPPDSDEFDDVTVLDPFTGGGTTHVELNRLGANTIGYELNPVAWWITKKSIDEVDLDALEEQYNRIMSLVRDDVGHYYKTEDPETGDEVDVKHYLMIQRLPCLTCDERVRLFPRYEIQKAKKSVPAVLYCPNEKCDNRTITITEMEADGNGGEQYRSPKDEETCPSCGKVFDPSDGNYTRAKYTCSNGHKHDVKETLKRRGEKPEFEYFAIQYVSSDGEVKWKEPDRKDQKKLENVSRELDDVADRLPLPSQELPETGTRTGTGRMRNYNYEYFREFFTDRQLLTFGKLFAYAKGIDEEDVRESNYDFDPQNIRDFLITIISSCLNRNSKLCKWDYDYMRATDVFARKAYISKPQPVEGNPLGADDAENMSSMPRFYERVQRAKEYCQRPFEKVKENGSTTDYYIRDESVKESRTNLRCQTAEQLRESDGSVDYVITDPPYYDNVQYSNLSEYFYVWLQKSLNDEYQEFQPEHVPNSREIIVSDESGKDDNFFIKALSNVFDECYRVLKEDGEIAFTFHHNESYAWVVVLSALMESGFTITGAYPVQSEMDVNPIISDQDNTEYDIIITANKDSVDEEITLQELRETLHFEVQEWIEEERRVHSNISRADLGVVLRGRCLYHFSKYHPEIYNEEEQVDVETALETADDIIGQVLESIVDLPVSIDAITQAYIGHLNRTDDGARSESFDDLRKHLMPHNHNVRDLEDERLVEGDRIKKRPVVPEDRVDHIAAKMKRNGELLDIDKIHYLYYLFTTDQDVAEYLRRWKEDDLARLADKMEEITGDDAYSQMMNLTLSNY